MGDIRMNQRAKIEKMREIFDKCLDIAEAKGHDYAGDQSALSNFADFGWQGVVVRLSDKYHRMKNFAKQGKLKVKDESIRDTFMDMINYAALGLIIFDSEHEGHKQKVYVAGKYSADTREAEAMNVQIATEWGKQVFEAGFVPIIPHRLSAHWNRDRRFADLTHDEWMERFCFPLLDGCQILYLYPGWTKSKGAKMELDYATRHSIPIAYSIEDLKRLK